MRLGINANVERPDCETALRRVLRWAAEHKISFSIAEHLVPLVGHPEAACPLPLLPEKSDHILSLGGDGTFLATARAVAARGTPVLGLNVGGFGFLTTISVDNLEKNLDRVRSRAYLLEERMVLEGAIEDAGAPAFALNDVVVEKGTTARLIHLALYVNGEYVSSYSADGLIVATPTGSTAYSLSVGGPIINPKINAIIVAPVSPHALTSRPIVFSEKDEIRIVLAGVRQKAAVSLDGQVNFELLPGQAVAVKKAPHTLKVVTFPETSFYDVLRRKFHWGGIPAAGKQAVTEP